MSNPGSDQSRLVPILREGVGVIQMIFFKEFKKVLGRKYPGNEAAKQTMLAGAVTNELFGTPNTEARFQQFRNEHRGTIEQELFALASDLPSLTPFLADALRIQTLCDHQEGIDSQHILQQADSFKILPKERDLPLPSTFMESVRKLGAEHNLLIPPAEIDKNEEQTLLQ